MAGHFLTSCSFVINFLDATKKGLPFDGMHLHSSFLPSQGPELASGDLSHKEELRQLKLKLGSWSLCPGLITPQTWWLNEMLILLGKPCWQCFSQKAKLIKTPQQVQAETMQKAASTAGWAAEVQMLILNGYHECGTLYPTCLEDESKALELHFNFLVKLLDKRVQSLSAYYLRAPMRYVPALDPNLRTAFFQKMKQEFDMILKGEHALGTGRTLKPLEHIHFRLNNVNRPLTTSQPTLH